MLTQLATLATFSSLSERTTWCGCPVSLSEQLVRSWEQLVLKDTKKGFYYALGYASVLIYGVLLDSLHLPQWAFYIRNSTQLLYRWSPVLHMRTLFYKPVVVVCYNLHCSCRIHATLFKWRALTPSVPHCIAIKTSYVTYSIHHIRMWRCGVRQQSSVLWFFIPQWLHCPNMTFLWLTSTRSFDLLLDITCPFFPTASWCVLAVYLCA